MSLRAPKGFIDESDPRVCQIGHPAPPWLVNYADLMTELVCFFVILYALSAALNKNVQNAAQQVQEMIEKKEVTGKVEIDKDGLKITLQEQGKNVFFESGSAELTPEMEMLMAKLSPVLKGLVNDHEIVVEGHTDALPIRNDLYMSNWELSTARATNVVEFLIHKHQFPPVQMAAVGYGEFRPLEKNDSAEHRQKNRRVVFFVKNSPVKPGAVKAATDKLSAEAAPQKPLGTPSVALDQASKKPWFFKRWGAAIGRTLSRFMPKFVKKWFNKG